MLASALTCAMATIMLGPAAPGGGAQQVGAAVGLDEGHLHSVQRPGVGEDDPALGELQRPGGEEPQATGGQRRDVLLQVGHLQGEVVDAFAPSADEPGYGALRVPGGDQADGGVGQVEAGPGEAGVGVVSRPQHARGRAQDRRVPLHRGREVADRYAHIDEAPDHRRRLPGDWEEEGRPDRHLASRVLEACRPPRIRGPALCDAGYLSGWMNSICTPCSDLGWPKLTLPPS